MFEIEKGRLRFLIFTTDKKVLVKLTSTSENTAPLLLYTIRDTIALLAAYHLNNTAADYKKGFLKQYFAQKGWKIKTYTARLIETNFGEMWVS